MYCYLIDSFGWTWEYIDDHMTIPRMLAINSWQSKYRPQHLMLNDIRQMIAAYLGIDLEAAAKPKDPNAAGVAEDGTTLFDMFPRG